MNCQLISSDPDNIGSGKETLRQSWGPCLLMQHFRAFTQAMDTSPGAAGPPGPPLPYVPGHPLPQGAPRSSEPSPSPQVPGWFVHSEANPPTLCLLLDKASSCIGLLLVCGWLGADWSRASRSPFVTTPVRPTLLNGRTPSLSSYSTSPQSRLSFSAGRRMTPVCGFHTQLNSPGTSLWKCKHDPAVAQSREPSGLRCREESKGFLEAGSVVCCGAATGRSSPSREKL